MTFNNMSPERRYIERSSIEHRKSFAQFFTPYHIADVMAEWILQKSSIQTILEPAFGLGIFSRILKYKKPSLKIQGVCGIRYLWLRYSSIEQRLFGYKF